jgi:hypothetical protein
MPWELLLGHSPVYHDNIEIDDLVPSNRISIVWLHCGANRTLLVRTV